MGGRTGGVVIKTTPATGGVCRPRRYRIRRHNYDHSDLHHVRDVLNNPLFTLHQRSR